MATFLGESLQEPPMYSALQVGGRRLYDIARAGEQVERISRRIDVSEMRLLAWRPPDAEFVVRVGSGTYVRTLARDLGVRCGSAAHLAALSRTAIGPFRLENAVTIADLAALAPGAAPPLVRLADALAHLPAVLLGEREARGVLDGRAPVVRPADLPAGLEPGGTLRLVDGSGRLSGRGPPGRAERPGGIPEGFQGAVAQTRRPKAAPSVASSRTAKRFCLGGSRGVHAASASLEGGLPEIAIYSPRPIV